PDYPISRQHMLRDLCCWRVASRWGAQCRSLGVVSRGAAIYPVCRPMGGGPFAPVFFLFDLVPIVHAADDDRFVHCVGGDCFKFCRALGLRCEYGRFSDRINYFGSVLDLALGPDWSCAFYSYHCVFGGDGTTCSAARVSWDFAKRR